jgi:hypothetical protein
MKLKRFIKRVVATVVLLPPLVLAIPAFVEKSICDWATKLGAWANDD